MDDEPGRLDVDARVREALAPDDSAARLIVAQALAAREDAPPWFRPAIAVVVVVALLVVVAGVWISRSRIAWTTSTRELSLAISGHGQMVVVERGDGRRWIVGPAPAPRPGGYVIVVPRGKE